MLPPISSRFVARSALALGLIVGIAAPLASRAQAPSPDKTRAASQISYENGQLTIHAFGMTLAEVLAKVAALTDVKIELPEGASAERMPIVELGPGSARQVLAALLSDSSFDYLIQASAVNSERLQSVLLMPRGKKDSLATAMDGPTRGARNPYARTMAPAPPPELPSEPQPDPVVSAQPSDSPSADANGLNPQPQPDQPITPAAAPQQPDLSTPPVYGQPLQTNVPKTFPVQPPPAMDQQNINQSLQQMYQQRMQMVQQEKQGASPNGNN